MTPGEWEPSAGGVTLAVLVGLVAMAAAVSPVAGSATTGSDPAADPSGGPAPAPSAAQVQATQTNNSTEGAANGTTVYHRNPDEVGGDVSEAEVWLASEMADRLSRSVELSQDQRQRAEQLVSNDSEYVELAEQYAEATDGANDSEQVAAFSAIGRTQRELLATVGTYRTVHQRYQEVRRGDNRTKERRLAHELGRLSRDVNRSAVELLGMYENVSENSSVDLRNTPEQIRDLRTNVSRTQRQVREQTLVGTQMEMTPVRTNGSFADPLKFEVRLTTAAGEPLANRNVTMDVGNESVEATTDRRGRFTLTYRPVEARTGSGARTIRYNPANVSKYASSGQEVELRIQQVEPNVTVADRPDRIGYGDRFVVEGRVAHGGVGASVPLNVSVGDVKLTTTDSADDGSFRAVAELPANVTAGERNLRVDVNLTDRALAGVETTVPVDVERTSTDLSITEARQREETVFVTGRLTTANGSALENQTVELRVGDTAVDVTTNATGGYSTSVSVPQGLRDQSAVEVRATYEDDDSNLAASRANATVSVSIANSSLPVRQTLFRVAGIVGVSVVGALLVRRYRPGEWLSSGDDPEESSESATAPDGPTVEDADPDPAVEAAFDAARDRLDAGETDAAVVTAYDAVRSRLGESGESPGDRSEATHWEFYADCRAAGLADERLDRLEELTGHYERAAFAAESVRADTAEEALELASSFPPDGVDGVGADASGAGGTGNDDEGDGTDDSDDAGEIGEIVEADGGGETDGTDGPTADET